MAKQPKPDAIGQAMAVAQHQVRIGRGGLHDDIPLANLEAYFDARAEVGVTPTDWRTRCRKEKTP